MKTKKRFLAVVLAAALLVAGLTGCKDALRGVAQKISGSSGEVQEEDTTRWADATADPLIIQGIADASAKFDTAMVDGTLYAVFNGIWSRQTNYFAAPNGTLTVMGARQAAPHRIEIPTEICGRRVAAIAPKAFFANGTLEQLVVGGGVREIGESAFFGCRQLVSVSFERGLECLRDSAFAGCESLTQVTLPWGTGAVGRMAFFGCTRLSFVKMPTTTRVSDFAFDGCAPGIRVFGGVYAGRMAANPAGE